MRITLLKRGGLSVYGGSYDAGMNAAICDAKTEQTVTIIFPAVVADVEGSGIDTSEAVISGGGKIVTLTGKDLSGTITATMGDERPEIRIETGGLSRDRYRCDC